MVVEGNGDVEEEVVVGVGLEDEMKVRDVEGDVGGEGVDIREVEMEGGVRKVEG